MEQAQTAKVIGFCEKCKGLFYDDGVYGCDCITKNNFWNKYKPTEKIINKRERANMKQIIPLSDRVLVKVLSEHPEKTPGGIIIPEAVKESPQEIGIVEAVGPGRFTEKGIFIVPTVQAGDKVLYNGMAGSKHNIDNPMGFEDYVLIRDTDILAIIIDNGVEEQPEEIKSTLDYE